MFIEVSSNSEKRIINACEIVSVTKDGEGSFIVLAHPDANKQVAYRVDQSYEDLLSFLIGVKE